MHHLIPSLYSTGSHLITREEEERKKERSSFTDIMMKGGLATLVVILVTLLGARAQGPSVAPSPSAVSIEPPPAVSVAPAPAVDCTSVLLDNLSTCLTYVEGGSNLTVPEKGCCSGLGTIVNNEPVCLCTLLSSSDTYGIQIDRTKALMLPTVCRVSTPPVSLCAVLGIPVPSPVGSPEASSGGPTSFVGSSPSSGPVTAAASTPKSAGMTVSIRRGSILVFLTCLGIASIAIF